MTKGKQKAVAWKVVGALPNYTLQHNTVDPLPRQPVGRLTYCYPCAHAGLLAFLYAKEVMANVRRLYASAT